MTIFEQTFRNLVIGSNLVDKRAFFWRAPQVPAEMAKTPYLVFFEIAPTTSAYPQNGPLTLQDRDYQISIYDPSQTRVVAIADSLRNYLDGYHATFENVRFGGVFFHTQVSTYEADTQLFTVMQDYRIQFHLLPDPGSNRSTNPQYERR